MRAAIKRDTNVVQMPDDFAILKKLTKDGRFVYKVRYLVDPVRAARNKAFKARIHVAQTPFKVRRTRTMTNFNPSAITQNLLKRSAQQKDKLRSFKESIILTKTSDFSADIPNNVTTQISRSPANDKPIIRKKLSVKAASVSDLNDRNLMLPVLEQNKNKEDPNLPTNNNSVRNAANQSLFNNRKDPAELTGQKSNNVTTAKQSVSGVSSRVSPGVKASTGPSKTITKAILNKNRLSNQSQLGNNDLLNVLTKDEFNFLDVEETLEIPFGELTEEEFYLIIQIEDEKGLELQTISRAVPHSKNVAKLNIPVKAPEVSAFTVGPLGRNVLSVKQVDENATSVNIYRRPMKKSQPVVDAEYTFVGSIELESSQPAQKVEDIFASIDPIIYRFVPVNESGILGASFSSTVIEQNRSNVAKKSKLRRRPYYVTISHEIIEDSILLSVKDLPTEPMAVEILRRDRTIFQKEFGRVTSNPILLDTTTNAPISIEDREVKPNRIYEYKVVLLFKDGYTEEAANNLIVEFTPVVSNIVSVNVGDPQIVRNGAEIDVQFSLEKDVIQTEGDLIKSFLEEQGLTAEFQEQLIQNRDRLQDLFGVRVTRTNLTTGRLEEFGIVDSTQFSDRRLGEVKNVEPPAPGFEYQYNITAHSRDPETLFSTLEKTIQDRENVSHTFKPSQWRHPITLSRGNLVTERTLTKNYSKSQFSFGTVVDSKTARVSLADILPSLRDGKASEFGENKVLVQWKVQGNVTKIDHFIVILELLGSRTIVGKSHNITNSNYFQFVDELENGESGALRYFIVPVFYDYSKGTELKTNQVII